MKHNFIKEVSKKLKPEYKFRYSICTIVTRLGEYEEMVESFLHGGFDETICEYLFIDNSAGNVADAFKAYNLFLQTAQGEYILICHQDVILLTNGIDQLDERIRELDSLDTAWAVLGNAGVNLAGAPVVRITHPIPAGEYVSGKLPSKVFSLDENFILVKQTANLCVSHDLAGFHLYGTDLCSVARSVGRTSWVIDFNLLHKGRGKRDQSFYTLCDQIEEKYKRFRREQGIVTMCTRLNFSGSWFRQKKTSFHRIYYAQKEHNPSISSWEEMKQTYGNFWYAAFWVIHKIQRPFENLARRLMRRN